MGWIVVAVRGRKASVLTRTVQTTRDEAEAFVAEQRTVDTMFNDETPRLVVLEVPEEEAVVREARW